MKPISSQQVSAVLRLDAPVRFEHFVKRVVDEGGAWGMWDGGWAATGDAAGGQHLPLWPAREYAELLRGDIWAACEPRRITLDDLLDLLAKLERGGHLVSVFPLPSGVGVVVSPKKLDAALREEMTKYECD
jgi:hypothetical protein